MSRIVKVDLGERTYPIHIGSDLPVGESLAGEKPVRALIISDTNVDPLHGPRIEAALAARGIGVTRAAVPAGEASKDLRVAGDLCIRAVAAGLDRDSVIVAVGGGMVGDLAGFVAATFLRGIRFIQVPTTLLAMVDSSVGGKTGVNLPQGKNLVGVFHQPIEVVADLATLRTLPAREYASGLAEVVKYGVIWDAVLLRQLEDHAGALLARDGAVLEPIVARCCEIKAEIVALDERETGVRAILNFGHTFGHALEAAAGYGGCLHGEAVAVGMAYAADLSVAAHGFAPAEASRLRDLLKRLGLPLSPADVGVDRSWEDLLAIMLADKKTRRRIPRFVLVEKPGSVVFGCEVTEGMLRTTFEGLACHR